MLIEYANTFEDYREANKANAAIVRAALKTGKGKRAWGLVFALAIYAAPVCMFLLTWGRPFPVVMQGDKGPEVRIDLLYLFLPPAVVPSVLLSLTTVVMLQRWWKSKSSTQPVRLIRQYNLPSGPQEKRIWRSHRPGWWLHTPDVAGRRCYLCVRD
jgi:hypothetical protein